MTWIAGYWSYSATPEPLWTWIPGHHLTAPAGQRWVAAKTEPGGSGQRYRYHPGGFCR
jgi:hypothetical protein